MSIQALLANADATQQKSPLDTALDAAKDLIGSLSSLASLGTILSSSAALTDWHVDLFRRSHDGMLLGVTRLGEALQPVFSELVQSAQDNGRQVTSACGETGASEHHLTFRIGNQMVLYLVGSLGSEKSPDDPEVHYERPLCEENREAVQGVLHRLCSDELDRLRSAVIGEAALTSKRWQDEATQAHQERTIAAVAGDTDDKEPPATETRGGEPQANGGTESESFCFTRTNDIYHISGFGEEVYEKSIKGLNVIARLIETPGVAVPMWDLLKANADQKADADNRSQQPTMDAEMKKNLQEHLADLRGDLDKAKDDDDLAAQERCEKEIEEIKDHVLKSEGLGGKAKDLNDSLAPMRKMIRGRLDTAYEKLGSERTPPTELAKHFMAAIDYESPAYIYRILPGDPINWRLNKY